MLRTKPLLDAFFAFVAERDDAGRLVGSKWAKTYLEKNLGIEPGDAYDRLARGRAFYGEPDVEEPAQESGSAEGSEDGSGDGSDGGFEFFGFGSDEEERQREERQREEARARQARARKAAAQVSEKKQRVIRL